MLSHSEIAEELSRLTQLHHKISEVNDEKAVEAMREFISGIRMLYEKALEMQHQQALRSMDELEAIIAAKHASIPAAEKAQAVHVESLLPKSTINRQEMQEKNRENIPFPESIQNPKTADLHPGMDELLAAASNKSAELNQEQESARRKKVITDIHDKFEEVPTLAGKFNDRETHAKRMAGIKMQTGIAEKHQRKAISDLKQSIGINEKFLFINQLFRGDAQVYDASINFLNNCGSIDAAKNYIHQNLQAKYDWDTSQQPVRLLLDLVERRFLS